jgi:hypothetical protein
MEEAKNVTRWKRYTLKILSLLTRLKARSELKNARKVTKLKKDLRKML